MLISQWVSLSPVLYCDKESSTRLIRMKNIYLIILWSLISDNRKMGGLELPTSWYWVYGYKCFIIVEINEPWMKNCQQFSNSRDRGQLVSFVKSKGRPLAHNGHKIDKYMWKWTLHMSDLKEKRELCQTLVFLLSKLVRVSFVKTVKAYA